MRVKETKIQYIVRGAVDREFIGIPRIPNHAWFDIFPNPNPFVQRCVQSGYLDELVFRNMFDLFANNQQVV